MREITIKKFASFDGVEHDTREACLKYERDNVFMRLIGLTAEQAIALKNGEDHDLAWSIETIGYLLGKARLARGDRRRRKPVDDEPFLPAPVGPGDPDQEPYQAPLTAEEALQVRIPMRGAN